MENINVINSYDSWSPLKEVWLGDVYPASFYDHLDSQVRDTFYQITEWTKEDLDKIQQKIESFGVKVQRPLYSSVDDYINPLGVLVKPDITPRDYYAVIGNRLFAPVHVKNTYDRKQYPWEHVIKEYQKNPDNSIEMHEFRINFSGANIVRVGRDIFVDCVWREDLTPYEKKQFFYKDVVPMFPELRCHYVENGGHVDACFATLKPGLIIANNYYDDYDRHFPGWELIMLDKPEFADYRGHYPQGFGFNGNFWLPDSVSNRAFNEHVMKYASDWVGNYKETYFEVNCLVIDEKNVLFLAENTRVFKRLEELGITPHVTDFRCRTFWDGGLHCLTVDINRQGSTATSYLNLPE